MHVPRHLRTGLALALRQSAQRRNRDGRVSPSPTPRGTGMANRATSSTDLPVCKYLRRLTLSVKGRSTDNCARPSAGRCVYGCADILINNLDRLETVGVGE